MNMPSNKHPQTGDILKLTELAQTIAGGTLVTAAIIVTVILGQQYSMRPMFFHVGTPFDLLCLAAIYGAF